MLTMSIHIGVNKVDPKEYGGWHGELLSCEADAAAMEELAAAQGIATRVPLRNTEATYARVMAELQQAAAALTGGDYLLITFAGHGASYKEIPVYHPVQSPSAESPATESPASIVEDPLDPDEEDGRDEAWCLYDTYLLDDELHEALLGFAPGVRICVVSDSCFSGTVTRGDKIGVGGASVPKAAAARANEAPALRERRMPPRDADRLYRSQFRTKYRSHSAAVTTTRARRSAAQIVLLAACQDDQIAREGAAHGLFTEMLLGVWKMGAFTGSHRDLIHEIRKLMPPQQQPNLFVTGAPAHGFEADPPFLNDRRAPRPVTGTTSP